MAGEMQFFQAVTSLETLIHDSKGGQRERGITEEVAVKQIEPAKLRRCISLGFNMEQQACKAR